MAAGVEALIFVVFGYFYGEHKDQGGYDRAVASIVQDSVEIRIDTVRIPYPDPFPVYIEREIEAEIDSIDGVITYFAEIDTTVMAEGDTLVVIEQSLSFSEGVFKTIMKIDIRPVEYLITLTRMEFRTVPVFIKADPPFYNTWIVGFISGVISFLILAVSLL